MKTILLLIASLMILLGLTGVLWPEGLIDLLKHSSGLYALAVVRMVLGALLLVGAKATRTPKTVRVIGVIIFAAGVATALISVERAQMLKDWWVSHGPDSLRIAACIPLAVGCFIAGSTVTRRG